jgi:hypothetical protein
MSAQVLRLGGEGVCPDPTMTSGGEREQNVGTACSTTGFTRASLPRYSPLTRGVGVLVVTGLGTGLSMGNNEYFRQRA